MLNIERALENDRLLRALTGLNRKAFDELFKVFGAVYEESLKQDPTPVNAPEVEAYALN